VLRVLRGDVFTVIAIGSKCVCSGFYGVRMNMINSSSRRYVRVALVGVTIAAAAVSAPSIRAQGGKAFIVQTNSAGDSIHLIDPVTDKIVAEVPDEEVVHGIAAAPDGSRFY